MEIKLKYELRKFVVEAKKPSFEAAKAEMYKRGNYDYEVLDIFDDIDQAYEVFMGYKPCIERYDTAYGFPVFMITWYELQIVDEYE